MYLTIDKLAVSITNTNDHIEASSNSQSHWIKTIQSGHNTGIPIAPYNQTDESGSTPHDLK